VVIKNHHHIDFIIGFIKATAIAITMDWIITIASFNHRLDLVHHWTYFG
jgi:hypothetical protein